jgi:YYY domain-containing protein
MFWQILKWYLLLSAAGLISFPIAFRLLPGLKDRGYIFTRALGLLLWGFILWFLGSLGILANSKAGILTALIILLILSLLAWQKGERGEMRTWLKENLPVIIATELLFMITFFGFAYFRALNPHIWGTEKPMELAFINAVIRSVEFPIYDPWQADYGISYYHFGYIMVGMLAKISGTGAGTAFNLGISMVFGLTALSAYGLGYDLLSASDIEKWGQRLGFALLMPLFVLVVSNAEGFLEELHMRGMFWEETTEGEYNSTFWEDELDILELEEPPEMFGGGGRGWWWWRASRVVIDYSFPVQSEEIGADVPVYNGSPAYTREMIDEFPFFSFLLADLHPHVLVMPFSLLAIALALNVYLARSGRGFRLFGLKFDLDPYLIVLGAVVFGGLAFLNLWDFPIYVVIFAAAYLMRMIKLEWWSWEQFLKFIVLGLMLGILGVLAYIFFFIGFSSQAGGILPNIINPSRGIQLLVMFGPFAVILLLFMIVIALKRSVGEWISGGGMGVVLMIGLFTLSIGFLYLLAYSSPDIVAVYGAPDLGSLLEEGLSRRLLEWEGWAGLTVFLSLTLICLLPILRQRAADESSLSGYGFIFLLILFGVLAIIGPEFFYLRDSFGYRMNTVFKFYLQGWLLLSISAAYGASVLLTLTKKINMLLYVPIVVLSIGVGLVYPYRAIKEKVEQFVLKEDVEFNLDGTDNSYYLIQDEHYAIEWLQDAPLGTLVEAVGGSYSSFARISTNSGQPALIGWVFHEYQWRGSYNEIGSREPDIGILYSTRNSEEMKGILQRYNIRYVFLGNLEFRNYDISKDIFDANLSLVFELGDVYIYESPYWSE